MCHQGLNVKHICETEMTVEYENQTKTYIILKTSKMK